MASNPKHFAEVDKPLPFKVELEGDAILKFEGDTVTVILRLRDPKQTGADVRPLLPAVIYFQTDLDRSLFADNEQAREWLAATMDDFRLRAWNFLAHEAGRFQSDVANQKLDEYGSGKADMGDIIADHARATEADLRARFSLRGAGNFSAWTKGELEGAVKLALSRLPAKGRNYEGVAAWMREHVPTKVATTGEASRLNPASGEALRQLLRRYKVNWKELKAERTPKS